MGGGGKNFFRHLPEKKVTGAQKHKGGGAWQALLPNALFKKTSVFCSISIKVVLKGGSGKIFTVIGTRLAISRHF